MKINLLLQINIDIFPVSSPSQKYLEHHLEHPNLQGVLEQVVDLCLCEIFSTISKFNSLSFSSPIFEI